jgi:hypothetical protein
MDATTPTSRKDDAGYYVVAYSLFPPGRLSLVLDTSYHSFARLHGVGECRVRIRLPNGDLFETDASIAIINTPDPRSARPHVMLPHPPVSVVPEGSLCWIHPR